jgi:hypothetical protein
VAEKIYQQIPQYGLVFAYKMANVIVLEYNKPNFEFCRQYASHSQTRKGAE